MSSRIFDTRESIAFRFLVKESADGTLLIDGREREQ